MEFFLLIGIMVVIGLLQLNSINTVSEFKKVKCKLHSWEYLHPDGGMVCKECGQVAGIESRGDNRE